MKVKKHNMGRKLTALLLAAALLVQMPVETVFAEETVTPVEDQTEADGSADILETEVSVDTAEENAEEEVQADAAETVTPEEPISSADSQETAFSVVRFTGTSGMELHFEDSPALSFYSTDFTVDDAETEGEGSLPVAMKGYQILSWNTAEDGSGISLQVPENNGFSELLQQLLAMEEDSDAAGQLDEAAENEILTLYAQTEPITYTISYDLNGGKQNSLNPTEYTVESGRIVLQEPTRKGYDFDGWYRYEAPAKRVYSLGAGKTGDRTLFAKWKVHHYQIRFLGNGATSGSMESMTDVAYDGTVTLPSNIYKRRGYSFLGWNTKADGSGTSYANRAEVSRLQYKDGCRRTLYAQWKKKVYTLSYELNGGTNSAENPTAFAVDTEDIVLKDPVRKGHTFLGWFTDSNYTTQVTAIAQGSADNRTLYARWRLAQYKICFYGNGAASGSTAAVTAKYSKTAQLTANGFARRGYKFTGWNTKADGSGTAYADLAEVRNLRSTEGSVVKLYAQWKIRTYTITYVLNGGKNSKKNPSTYTVETATISLKDPTNSDDDLIFAGWYSNAAMTKRVRTIELGSAGSLTLYAKWTRDILGDLCDYCQSDPRWAWAGYAGGTMADSGCGPAACADITGETPYTVAVWLTANGYASNGSGTYWPGPTAYLNAKGLHAKEYSNYSSMYGSYGSYAENCWLSTMKAGNSYGILLMGPGYFTSGGHFIVIAAVDGNNNCYVLDPANSARSGWHAWSDFQGMVKIFYSCDR